jgi:hypothetical protein
VNFLPAPSSWEVCGVFVRVLTWASDEILEHFKQSLCKIHFWIAVDQSTIHVECGRWEEARRSIPAGGGFWMPSLAPLLDWLRGDFGASDFFCLGKVWKWVHLSWWKDATAGWGSSRVCAPRTERERQAP